MVCGFIKLNGSTVGAVANRTEIYDEEGNLTESMDAVLSARGARKAADFVKFCDAFNIPVLTLTNVTGFKATKCSEANMAKAVAEAKLNTFANATATVNVIMLESLRKRLPGYEQQIYRSRYGLCMAKR